VAGPQPRKRGTARESAWRRRVTSWPSLRDDLRNAGAEPVDEQVVVDGQFTTSRSPAGSCRPGDSEFSTSQRRLL
jgi:protease I